MWHCLDVAVPMNRAELQTRLVMVKEAKKIKLKSMLMASSADGKADKLRAAFALVRC